MPTTVNKNDEHKSSRENQQHPFFDRLDSTRSFDNLLAVKRMMTRSTTCHDDDEEMGRRRRPSTSSSSPRITRPITLALIAGAAVLGFLLTIELIVVLAFLAPPTIGAMTSLEGALNVYGGQNPQPVKVMLNVDAGGNLTNILSDPSGLVSMGASLLAPAAPTTTPANVSEDLQVRAVEISDDEAFESLFMEWCVASSCAEGAAETPKERARYCNRIDLDLLTAQRDGKPVIPLPRPFCSALDDLSGRGCLCAGSGLADVSADTKRLVQMATVSAAMCGLRLDAGC